MFNKPNNSKMKSMTFNKPDMNNEINSRNGAPLPERTSSSLN